LAVHQDSVSKTAPVSRPSPPSVGTEEELSAYVDLDVLRGWRERRDTALQAEHALPALAWLVHIDRDGSIIARHPIHGPDSLLGRYHAQYAPVDVVFSSLRDFESYKIGAPHLHLICEGEGRWACRPLSPLAHTWLNGALIEHGKQLHRLASGDNLRLGAAKFIFEQDRTSLARWQDRRREVLRQARRASLFLMRHGAVCGPYFELDDTRSCVIGRTSPSPGDLPGTQHWETPPALDWDLAGLHDRERKHIAFRHIKIGFSNTGQWMVEPLSRRQATFVNRVAITGPTPLSTGDEIGLGSMIFYFHHPSRSTPLKERPGEVPPIADWDDGRPPASGKGSRES
jgi:hypothetical protein